MMMVVGGIIIPYPHFMSQIPLFLWFCQSVLDTLLEDVSSPWHYHSFCINHDSSLIILHHFSLQIQTLSIYQLLLSECTDDSSTIILYIFFPLPLFIFVGYKQQLCNIKCFLGFEEHLPRGEPR